MGGGLMDVHDLPLDSDWPLASFGLKWFAILAKHGVPRDVRMRFVAEAIETNLTLIELVTKHDMTAEKMFFGAMVQAIEKGEA